MVVTPAGVFSLAQFSVSVSKEMVVRRSARQEMLGALKGRGLVRCNTQGVETVGDCLSGKSAVVVTKSIGTTDGQ